MREAVIVRRFVALVLFALWSAGCSGTAQVTAAPGTPAATTPPKATPTSNDGSNTAPTPIAVLEGEKWLAYSWRKDPGGWYVGLMRPDGTGAHEILNDVPGEHKVPAWSPDGKTLAFVVKDADSPEGSIWTANADGTGSAVLSRGGDDCPVGLFHPSWSPDGQKLAVVCYPGGDQEAIGVMDLATKSVRRLATYEFPDHLDNAPTWSPDGTTLVFDLQHWDPTGAFLDGTLIATVPVAGGEVKRLTSFDTFMAHADWRPDGLLLVMNSYDLGNIPSTIHPSNLYTMKPDGSGLAQLTHSSIDGSMRIGQPRWDSDGTRIVVSVATAGEDLSINDVRLGWVEASGGEPVLISQTDAKYPDPRPTK
jgi:Tol biopolymer transport system component